MTFWQGFLDWHIRTDHPWDTALWIEAMNLQVKATQILIAEQLSPVFDKLARDLVRLFR